MKTDRKLLLALAILIGLVIWLIVISLNRSQEVTRALEKINELEIKVPTITQPLDGKTPVLGIDYFNGQNGKDGAPGKDGKNGENGHDGSNGLSAYEIAVKYGFIGTEKQWLASLKGDKGDAADEQQVECMYGLVAKKRSTDDLWQMTSIGCSDE